MADVVSMMTGIPVTRVAKSESEKQEAPWDGKGVEEIYCRTG